MKLRALPLAAFMLALGGCATSHYYETNVTGVRNTAAFVDALDSFLKGQGLIPDEEIYKGNPQLLAEITHGQRRWDKSFKFTWPEQAGFIAVSLGAGAGEGDVELSVGSSGNREREASELAGVLKQWLNSSYPMATVIQSSHSFVDLR